MVRLPLHVPEQGETDVRRNNAKRRGGQNGVNLKADGTSSGVRLIAQTGGEMYFSFVCLNYQEKAVQRSEKEREWMGKKKKRTIDRTKETPRAWEERPYCSRGTRLVCDVVAWRWNREIALQ